MPVFTVSLARIALMGDILAACCADLDAEQKTVNVDKTAPNKIAGSETANTKVISTASSTSSTTAFTKMAEAATPPITPSGIPIPPRKKAS